MTLDEEIDLFRRIFDTMPEHAVLVLSPTLRYTHAFGPLLLILQVTPEQLLGHTIRDVLDGRVPEDEIVLVEDSYRDAMRGAGTVIIRERHYADHWIEQVVFPVYRVLQSDDADAELHAGVSVLRNIDHRKNGELHLANLTTTDDLTLLANGRGFTAALRQPLRAPTSLLAIDVNDFKQVNDTQGHDAGDRVLVEIARCIAVSTRPKDFLARPHGDEFAVLLYETEASVAFTIAMRIRLAVSKALGSVSVSIGSATYPDDAPDVESLLRVADERMYIDKRGRGR